MGMYIPYEYIYIYIAVIFFYSIHLSIQLAHYIECQNFKTTINVVLFKLTFCGRSSLIIP